MNRMAERELFTIDYAVPPDELWRALKRSLRTMDLKEVAEDDRSARFSTGVTTFSWGEHVVALVEGQDGRSRLVVRGRPKSSIFTTDWGENHHARRVQEHLGESIESALSIDATP